MKFQKNMQIGVSIIFLLLIFTASLSLIEFNKKNEIIDNKAPSISAAEDLYEPNNYYWDSNVITLSEYTWLSNINGLGTQLDDDYFRIYVAYGYQQVKINLTFLNTLGDINLELCDYNGFPLFVSNSPTDNEFLDVLVPYDGDYYIRIFGNNTGNTYDLIWESHINDDVYEENDDRVSATDISGPSYRFMSHVGRQLDDDWYQVFLMPDEDRIHVDVYHDKNFGDIYFELFHWDGISLTWIETASDTCIDIFVSLTGTFYIHIYGDNSGNEYDLRWEGAEDAYEYIGDYSTQNDDISNAYDLSTYEGRWLKGSQLDDDYYRIQVKPGELRLIVFLRFFHGEGDIDIELRDSSSTYVTSSTSVSDNEFIDMDLSSWGAGMYYLKVYYGNNGNPYDLLWEDRNLLQADDNYEENDNNPYISPPPHIWLSSLPPKDGLGIQADDDWYQVHIALGENSLYIELIYDNTQGNFGIEIFDNSPTRNYIGGFDTSEYIEYFNIPLSSGNSYNIKVYGTNQGVVYDLRWGGFSEYTMSDDSYEYNNNNFEAFDLTPYQGLWLTEIYGPGYQFDDDWFKIYVEPDHERLVLGLYGAIDVEVFDSNLIFVDGSFSIYHDGPMDIILPEIGLYYILVSGYNNGDYYDLMVETLSPIGDDPYEINDRPDQSFIHIQNEQTWLSELEGLAVQGNEDWYAIEVTPGFLNLEVDLLFNHSLGDINMEIYLHEKPEDSSNTGGPPGGPSGAPSEGLIFEARSDSFDDNEYINTNVSKAGIYLIKVYGDNTENEYNLWWDDIKTVFSDDMYEENDDSNNAYVGMVQNMWLWGGYSDPTGTPQLALQYDNDWYKITVESGFERLIVEMKYDIAEGMLGFEIYNVNLTEITGNFSMVDDAKIDYVLSSSGIYYIRVYGDNTGNVYNLRFFTSKDIPVDEIPGYDILILIISIVGVSAVVIKKKRSKFKNK